MKRSLPKKQKLISIDGTSAGKITNKDLYQDLYQISNINCYSNAYRDTLNCTGSQPLKEKEGVQIKTELVEKNVIEKNVQPGSSGSSGSELKFISDFQKELNNHLLDKDTKICSLEEDLKFIKHVLEKTKCNLKNEKAEKEKIANELSELRKTHNNMVQENKRTETLFVKEITSIQQQLTTSQNACAKLKTDAINFISNFNPFDKNGSDDQNHSKSQPKPRILESEENFLNFITLGIQKNLSETSTQK